MVRTYLQALSSRAMWRAWSNVIAHSWQALIAKIASTGVLLVLAYAYVHRTTGADDNLFSDQATIVGLAVAAAAMLVLSVFFVQLLIIAPYQLWREQKERADRAEADAVPRTEAARVVADCTKDGVVDLVRLRAEMDRITDPDREFGEEWERAAAEERADRAYIGSPGAAVFGIDADRTFVAVDITNYGRTPAYNVTWKAVAGWFPSEPVEPIDWSTEGRMGITEPGQTQNVMLILTRPLTTAELANARRGGPGLYAVMRIDYADAGGAQRYRRMAYYLDLDRPRDADRWMMSNCPSGQEGD